MKLNQLTETSLSRVWQHVQSNMPFALLTTFRDEYDHDTNIRNNKLLANAIRQQGYGFFYVDGYWIENQGTPEEIHVSEDSIFVVGKENDDDNFLTFIISQIKQWNQEAGLIKVNNVIGLYDKSGQSIMTFTKFLPGQLGDIYTKIRNNKRANTFVFENERDSTGFFGQWVKST